MSQVRLENIRPSDIEEGREKETLALIWAIILHYQSELKGNYTLHDESHNSRNCFISFFIDAVSVWEDQRQYMYNVYTL